MNGKADMTEMFAQKKMADLTRNARGTGHRGRMLLKAGALVMVSSLLSGCLMMDRLSDLGQEPEMSSIQNPRKTKGYQPVSMPMPAPITAERTPNSLWRPGARAFFKDQRANTIGDIVTVVIQVNDEATLENTTTFARTNSRDIAVPSILGFETQAGDLLPDAFDPTNAVEYSGSVGNTNGGDIDRKEDIFVQVAAVVTQVLPNGNLVLYGRQELRVNYEKREVLVGGVVRPQDITAANTIPFEKIAEARIAYGGRGALSDRQTPPWGDELLDIFLPF